MFLQRGSTEVRRSYHPGSPAVPLNRPESDLLYMCCKQVGVVAGIIINGKYMLAAFVHLVVQPHRHL